MWVLPHRAPALTSSQRFQEEWSGKQGAEAQRGIPGEYVAGMFNIGLAERGAIQDIYVCAQQRLKFWGAPEARYTL